MKDNTKKLLHDLSEIMIQKCKSCPSEDKFRCCDKLFCESVEEKLIQDGVKVDKPNVGGIPFMGDKGCVLSPELRPLCTGFSCRENFEDRKFRRQYDRILDKINKDSSIKLSKVRF